jgi:hypothetical protein
MPTLYNTPYLTKSAVLFVIFNRPDTTFKVFEQIKAAKPKRLYIAGDAPRENVLEDKLLCEQARSVVEHIDWECEVKTLFNKKNKGCKDGVSAAVDWFFDNEEEGIVLEDDCLPSNSFFKFCDTLLEKYRDDTRIRHITGCNLQNGKKWGNASYYFANRTHVWGWASWRRVWKDYDKNLNNYSEKEVKDQIGNIYNDSLMVKCWVEVFNRMKTGETNSWAYALDFVNFFNNGLTIIPNENLISNIGWGSNATHTLADDNIFANVPLSEIDEITHPVFILPEKNADYFTMSIDFNFAARRKKENSLKRKAKRFAKDLLKQAAAFSFLS